MNLVRLIVSAFLVVFGVMIIAGNGLFPALLTFAFCYAVLAVRHHGRI